MTQVGRNDRCPCGSGRKYKKCCLPEQEKNARIAMRADQQRAMERALVDVLARDHHRRAPQDMGIVPPGVDGHALDELSNGVLALIDEGRHDEALVGCQRLLDEYPGLPDGFEMSALAHDALGNHSVALDFWEKLLDFAEHPSRRRDYSDDLIAEWRQSRDRSSNLARAQAEAQPAQVADRDRAP